jgi:hypothetical protein
LPTVPASTGFTTTSYRPPGHEIDYDTAQEWGTPAIGYVLVKIPANGGDVMVDRIPPLWEWYAANALSFEWFPGMLPASPTVQPTRR